MQRVTILGSTGSIGVSTLDVLARHPERFEVFALTAATRWQPLLEQCLAYTPQCAVMSDPSAAEQLRQALQRSGSKVEVLSGTEALVAVAQDSSVDTVMAAIVGAAGLLPTFAAVKAGKRVLLANKEVLVMAGHLFMAAAKTHGAQILPIDSEHNAIFQCLPLAGPLAQGIALAELGVSKIVLTASGGPFRQLPLSQLSQVTPEQACNHPNWSMGPKISVDSATMMNKGLEFIEACWLFNARARDVEVVIHPQSVIHSMVEYVDGSVLAQLGNPDMRTPIAHALGMPERLPSGVERLDLVRSARLDFEALDEERFPCMTLARQAAERGGTCPAILNAANEEAVAAFLASQLQFNDIAQVIAAVLDSVESAEPVSLDAVQQADLSARQRARVAIQQISAKQ
ncbi:1-deoxy-D-xylulose-5-phosphate reductoisomerase [Gilvimarinus agarilyticus]|uniref:1-deoxy-D-xylulose-5-phosphate reductoisomerase n=1 Tax=Gilvimarinus sp. 2_MG-2023 TaxID=3062666 RepID=UPI001C08741B|nr:1-deoxy-D-xylulose-5-phosphate reductoisomerase [Gilvimarinus sp. 2_MG-2023]MBU2886977.1 1-deoxy-D-xylulose-5-phosphate reductoisomerase [Gilvimarinus agarilyticus]MDO6571637.1 1-deoxy-D-xylulose-5-phosphate reductoisomerase [Gilvimarinus sp. 2_MG-2023]